MTGARAPFRLDGYVSDVRIRTLGPEEVAALRERVINLFHEHAMNTAEIAEEVGFHEAWVDREISKYLDRQLAAGISTGQRS